MIVADILALDGYYLAVTALVTLIYQLLFFTIAFLFDCDKLTDFAGGSNFIVLAVVTLVLSGAWHTRQIIASMLLVLWAARLSGFLLFRVLGTGKDDRFGGHRVPFLPFLGGWLFQMIWVWTVSLPVTVLNSPAIARFLQRPFGTGCDIAGVVLYAIGLVIESVSDAQKYRFHARHPEPGAICDTGLFYFSRHPNYFGEILLQFSIYTVAVSAADGRYVSNQASQGLYATILSPVVLMTLILFVSGLSLVERPSAKERYEQDNDWETYSRYLQRTSILIPFSPRLYEHVPTYFKRTLFLEFPMYVFDPAKHADVGLGEGCSGVDAARLVAEGDLKSTIGPSYCRLDEEKGVQ
ncbi:DUF1295-domain-containing protein [Sodiomyces alkalinus F11]|uniref:DUF1295-domain-containing protein n=1 Tax=Sodiomyces alkalinus (strain CBS 110278 / VKM F-3762 / F11) TaxID=1314773 RepID=A0A3N2Q6E7_SODAK|nr:DUF1295-domain-containing protein [Sodiomyces alkalinus F11]ROT42310.1 DUF1295-domain-containing protein [Sodiomyces alkalinus F11]